MTLYTKYDRTALFAFDGRDHTAYLNPRTNEFTLVDYGTRAQTDGRVLFNCAWDPGASRLIGAAVPTGWHGNLEGLLAATEAAMRAELSK